MAAADVIEKIFDNLDVDKDGTICQKELEGIFTLFDENNDGHVSKAEFEDVYASKLGGTTEHAGKVFKHLDSDGDGQIGSSEISDLFKRMDKDGNGKVSKAEFVELWNAMMA